VTPDELRRWKIAARREDLSLSQAMRRGMKLFMRETEQQLAAGPSDEVRD
jgi:hypothetical protein